MVDRQDIDALLIGSLYGELSSTDEARLQAHLESHPADRTALDRLVRARAVVRESRILEVQLEPPQSVSALLLQEAARRAPRKARDDERESWFVRFRRAFLMHPAAAAAAMLIVVIGVAGTIYLRRGDHFAAPEVASEKYLREPSTEAPAAAPPMRSTDGATDKTGYQVSLTERAPAGNHAADYAGAGSAAPAAPAPSAAPAAAAQQPSSALATATPDVANARNEAKNTAAAPEQPGGAPAADPTPSPPRVSSGLLKADERRAIGRLDVTTPSRAAPKELDDDRTKDTPAGGESRRRTEPPPSGTAGFSPPADSQAARGAESTTVLAQPGAIPIDSEAAKGRVAAPATGGSSLDNRIDRNQAPEADLAWARDQHTRLVTQIRNGKCPDAAAIAVQLSNRAPSYFQQNVETDRAVKDCLAYINAERERAADRARVNADRASFEESPSPAPTKAPAPKAAPARPAAKPAPKK